jgi:UDPglucose 6-dehydrogenase
MNKTAGTSVPMPGTIGAPKYVFNFKEDFAKIGIVGLGFVGNAIKESMAFADINIIAVDRDLQRSTHNFEDLKDCEGIFVAVPTPFGENGECDTSILEEVLEKLNELEYSSVVISKCTAPPDVYKKLNDKYPNLIHAPEFLTAANAVSDYANGTFCIIGGRIKAYQREAERIIRIGQTNLKNISYCSISEASLSKYVINSFMATKVIFMNEIYKLSEKIGTDYKKIANMVTMDPRIGKSHMQVPGPDGSFGFGGACFPKDTSALLKFAENSGVDLHVLDAAVHKNTLLRLTESK